MESTRLYRRLSLSLQAIILAETLLALWNEQWGTAFVTLGIVLLTLVPLVVARRFRIYIPPQFQLLTVAIVFAALFLGEVRNYYYQFPWWDSALHTVTGFLMGIVGFFVVYISNQIPQFGLQMRAGFVASVAFIFALSAGAVWEVSEFILDSLFDLNLQKPMLDDPSGLTDTMIDLMLDAAGAAAIAIYGYYHLKRHLKRPGKESFLERWITSFITHNPRIFRRSTRRLD